LLLLLLLLPALKLTIKLGAQKLPEVTYVYSNLRNVVITYPML